MRDKNTGEAKFLVAESRTLRAARDSLLEVARPYRSDQRDPLGRIQRAGYRPLNC